MATAEKQNELSIAAQAPAANVPAVMSDTASLMAVIARAAADPNTDVDKMERLMAMFERTKASNAKAAYFAALSEMQDKMPVIRERGEIKIDRNSEKPGQKYALWEDINKAIKPILREHGFALSFRTGLTDSKITVTGVLSHRDGHSEETTIHLPSDTSGSKNAVQAVGSSTSYGKRYTAAALLNISSTGDDDDGVMAGGQFITDDQVATISDLLDRTGGDPEKFCSKAMKVECIAKIKRSDYGKAIQWINEADLARKAKARMAAEKPGETK